MHDTHDTDNRRDAALPSVASEVPRDGDLVQFSLKKAFLHGSAWSFAGYAAEQGLRLAGNLVLTRLLFPKAFGLMALVNIFLQGLAMFSDIGIGPSIIQHPRGTEPGFLNTAWTVQVIRGVVLAACGCLLAWPVARIYGQDELLLLLPVAGLSIIISGFNSTALHTENRRLVLGRITAVTVAAHATGLVVMVTWACVRRSVWALLAGSVVTAAVKMILSHTMLPGPRNKLHWEPDAWRDLLKFGRWIFLSTAFSFLASQGDRLVLGVFLPIDRLGVYNIALFLAKAIVYALTAVSMSALFPLYSRLKEHNPVGYEKRVWKYRCVFLAIGYPILAVQIVFGDVIVKVLYDDRYLDAGWMLQVLSVGAVASVMNLTMSGLLLAVGNSFSFMLFQLGRWLCLISALCIGATFYGVRGLILGVAVSAWMAYPLLVLFVRRYRIWTPKLDFLAMFAVAGAVGLGFLVKQPVVEFLYAVVTWVAQSIGITVL